ncbi:hypothetical protein [Xenorhabdus hominickii]|uniref:Virulence factor Evf domain-containing protein n=1 Tax=Xenorhabdus hominickii TaxID=351679 RepID=A0A2G0Q4V8_XENHO|nr:hypothetical protein [Xenorhabdus hominickii]AOM40105.1 hypothetical protein A9255_05645 [Xenorhabdus hominickii]PHM54258.1 hypothetical protein Xhom_03335 [Xenorhabdus hominickii]
MNIATDKKHKNYLINIQQADQFFSADIDHKFSLSNYRLNDTDGLVQFIITSQITDQANVIKQFNEIKKTQIALSSIATDYINQYVHAHGKGYKTDIQFWGDIIAKLPLMSVRNIESQTYRHEMVGFSIATNLLQLIMDLVLSTYSPSMQSFSNFLRQQGEAIRLGLKRNDDHYSTLTLASVIEAIGVEGQVMYVPKLKLYKIDFNRTNSEITSNCASNETINVEFTYSSYVALFDYQALEDPEIKMAFDNFLLKNKRFSIENSDNFFNGEFKV